MLLFLTPNMAAVTSLANQQLAVVENSAKTQFRITRWNYTLKARCSLSSNINISAQNASKVLKNPPFESVFPQLVNDGRIISVSSLYMNPNALDLPAVLCARVPPRKPRLDHWSALLFSRPIRNLPADWSIQWHF